MHKVTQPQVQAQGESRHRQAGAPAGAEKGRAMPSNTPRPPPAQVPAWMLVFVNPDAVR